MLLLRSKGGDSCLSFLSVVHPATESVQVTRNRRQQEGGRTVHRHMQGCLLVSVGDQISERIAEQALKLSQGDSSSLLIN